MIEPNMLLAGRYRLIEQIDSGGSAYIYKAIDEKTKQEVAVKILKPELTENEEFIQRFKKEVQASLKLRHANIIRAYDAGLDQGTYYIVMDLIHGKTLKNLINTSGPLPVKYVVNVAKKLCLALEYAHVKGFVHRDIKPHNIMIDMTGEPYIADFGIARNTAQNTITVEDNSVMGSVHYFSPEQARGERVDKRSDIYSLGILVYEMLTGHVPFDADTSVAIALKHINEPMPDVHTQKTDVPESINKIIQKATQKDKHFRYKSAFNMYEDLQRCLSEPDGEYVRYTESRRVQQHLEEQQVRRSRRSLKRLVLVFAAAALIVFAIIAITSAVINFNTEKPVEMLSVVGLTQKNAQEAVKDITSVPTITYEYSAEAVKGVVIRQEPIAGEPVKKGDPVLIVVSQGTGTDTMPDVTNIDIAQAKKILAESGIELNQIVKDTKGDQPVDYVIGQYPEAGKSISESGSVWLTIKASPDADKVVLPNVQGEALDTALGQLQTLGFKTFYIYEKSSDVKSGTILSQSPQADNELAVNKPVALTVSKIDGARYTYKEKLNLTIPKDGTKLKIGIQTEIDGIQVYYIIYDTIVSSGEQEIDLKESSSIVIDSNDKTVTQDLMIFMDDTFLRPETVTFAKGG